MSVNRRSFLKGTLAAGGMALTTSALATQPARYRRILGANDRMQMAVIGFGSRGKALINAIGTCKDAELVALCDADSKILEGFRPDQKYFRTTDFRDILDSKDVNGIASATPNHWHTLIAMLGCEAGKHVYIEKPISHNMHESRQVVKAARKNNCIVQCGFQNRSDSGLTDFYRRLHAGEFGAVQFVHGTCHRQRDSIGKLDQPLEIPDNIDFDKWLGPAADQPIMRPRLHYDWHWDFNTGNGDVGNQGPHEWDLMNWALGSSGGLPSTMVAAGNRFGWKDAGNTPNIMACLGVLDGVPFCFEVMDLKVGVKPPMNVGVGVVIHTDKGYFAGGRGGGRFVSNEGGETRFTRAEWQKDADGTDAHMQNFFDAIVAGDHSMLHADCAVAANSSAMAHMANISYQLGTESSLDEIQKAFSGNDHARDMIERLSRAPSEFDAQADEPWILGPQLIFDSDTRQFVGNLASEANLKMTRDYRAGYELPDVG